MLRIFILPAKNGLVKLNHIHLITVISTCRFEIFLMRHRYIYLVDTDTVLFRITVTAQGKIIQIIQQKEVLVESSPYFRLHHRPLSRKFLWNHIRKYNNHYLDNKELPVLPEHNIFHHIQESIDQTELYSSRIIDHRDVFRMLQPRRDKGENPFHTHPFIELICAGCVDDHALEDRG
jgi:hypothetical protein